ncbi:hypothetical protein DY000_02016349 [Brassica cretica]|uniref:Clp R domain-containing protein n=1 Tax=Brassica cretica TaxID=69181 RepID=A0ABQ7CMY5_BRACR|nr:hypothetical protein DY000_02016349 [Brassica cretica]
MEVLSTSSPLTLHSRRLASSSSNRIDSSSSHVASFAASSLSSFASSYLGVSLSNCKIQRFSTTATNFHRFPPKKRKKFTPISAVFERFTERAIRAIIFSQKEAKSLGKDMVYPQHLLLGLIAEDRDPQGFLGSGVTVDKAREVVWSIWDEANSDSNLSKQQEESSTSSYSKSTDMPFSISTKRVFEAAVEYSRTLDCQYIAPEHIAVGLFTVDDGSAGRVLKRLGANMNLLTAAALTRLKGEIAKDGREPPSSPNARIVGPGRTKTKSVLEQFCVDLTARAVEGLIDPVIGREKEVERVIQILCRRTKNNPILLGEAGVGKTAIAEGLAISIAEANAPGFLLGKRIMSLDIGLLMAGAKERGELESRGSGLDIANLLKPSLGRGELQCIASTTLDEFRSQFEKDKALARRFQPVLIDEPSEEDAVKILLGLREKYEAHHNCKYTMEAIDAAVYLSSRYIADRFLPDKAIDLIDEAGSRARIEAFRKKKDDATCILSKPPDDYWQEIRIVQAMHEVVLSSRQNQDDGSDESGELVEESSLPPAAGNDEPIQVGPDDIAAVASAWSGIPVQQITADERMLLMGLEEKLRSRVVGQDEAVAAISRAVKRSRVGLKDPDRPIAAMLFCGPTGVGKTELTKALSANYFGSEESMLRLDMSEYMERHTVSKLIGSPPGYVGFEEGGMLTEAIRRRPFTVVLFDEIEKAHPDIFNILLQLFEDGHLTDSQGRRVSFKNALIIMTSNVGSSAIAKGRHGSIGFILDDDEEEASYAGMKATVVEELKNYFRPELLNRIDEIVIFRQLEKAQMMEILNLMLQDLKSRLVALGVGLEVSEPVKELICRQGYDPSYGARPLRRTVTEIVEDPLSEAFLAGNFKPGATAFVVLDDTGNPSVRTKPDSSTVRVTDKKSIA